MEASNLDIPKSQRFVYRPRKRFDLSTKPNHTPNHLTLKGMWWYKSIRYTGDQVLIRTTQLYLHCLMKSPQMILKRAIMVLGSSLEYEKSNNPEIVERPSDNVEMPALMRDLPDLQEKIREIPFSYLFRWHNFLSINSKYSHNILVLE